MSGRHAMPKWDNAPGGINFPMSASTSSVKYQIVVGEKQHTKSDEPDAQATKTKVQGVED